MIVKDRKHAVDCLCEVCKALTHAYDMAEMVDNTATMKRFLEWVDKERRKSLYAGDQKLGTTDHDGPITIKDGKTVEGLIEALYEYLEVAIRYNLRASRPEIKHHETEWEPFHDRHASVLREVLAGRFIYVGKDGEKLPLKFSLTKWGDIFNFALYRSEVDPFREWLEGLPTWDGEPRLDTWLSEVFVIKERLPLAKWAGRYMLLGAIARTFGPGTTMQEIPVLLGPPGVGKSTCLRFLLPPDRNEWFSDDLTLAMDSKTKAEALQGRVIVEVGEMGGATTADLGSIQRFLSRTDDGSVRLAYRRDPELMPRRCVIIGTGDKEMVLPNAKNLRRFVPINIIDGDPGKVREYLEWDRRQLWAEAMVLYRQGVEARLPDELKPMQAEATARARSRDTAIEEAVEEWTQNHDGFTLTELGVGVHLIYANGAPLGGREQHRLGSALEGLGFSKRQASKNGQRATRWYKD